MKLQITLKGQNYSIDVSENPADWRGSVADYKRLLLQDEEGNYVDLAAWDELGDADALRRRTNTRNASLKYIAGVVDPEWAQFTYEQIIGMEADGVLIPDDVLKWAHAMQKAEADISVLDAASAEEEAGTSNNNMDIKALRESAMQHIAGSTEDEQKIETALSEFNPVIEDMKKMQNEIEDLMGSVESEIEDLDKEWKDLDQKVQSGEQLSAEQVARYRALGKELYNTKKELTAQIGDKTRGFADVANSLNQLDKFVKGAGEYANEASSIGYELAKYEAKHGAGPSPESASVYGTMGKIIAASQGKGLAQETVEMSQKMISFTETVSSQLGETAAILDITISGEQPDRQADVESTADTVVGMGETSEESQGETAEVIYEAPDYEEKLDDMFPGEDQLITEEEAPEAEKLPDEVIEGTQPEELVAISEEDNLTDAQKARKNLSEKSLLEQGTSFALMSKIVEVQNDEAAVELVKLILKSEKTAQAANDKTEEIGSETQGVKSEYDVLVSRFEAAKDGEQPLEKQDKERLLALGEKLKEQGVEGQRGLASLLSRVSGLENTIDPMSNPAADRAVDFSAETLQLGGELLEFAAKMYAIAGVSGMFGMAFISSFAAAMAAVYTAVGTSDVSQSGLTKLAGEINSAAATDAHDSSSDDISDIKANQQTIQDVTLVGAVKPAAEEGQEEAPAEDTDASTVSASGETIATGEAEAEQAALSETGEMSASGELVATDETEQKEQLLEETGEISASGELIESKETETKEQLLQEEGETTASGDLVESSKTKEKEQLLEEEGETTASGELVLPYDTAKLDDTAKEVKESIEDDEAMEKGEVPDSMADKLGVEGGGNAAAKKRKEMEGKSLVEIGTVFAKLSAEETKENAEMTQNIFKAMKESLDTAKAAKDEANDIRMEAAVTRTIYDVLLARFEEAENGGDAEPLTAEEKQMIITCGNQLKELGISGQTQLAELFGAVLDTHTTMQTDAPPVAQEGKDFSKETLEIGAQLIGAAVGFQAAAAAALALPGLGALMAPALFAAAGAHKAVGVVDLATGAAAGAASEVTEKSLELENKVNDKTVETIEAGQGTVEEMTLVGAQAAAPEAPEGEQADEAAENKTAAGEGKAADNSAKPAETADKTAETAGEPAAAAAPEAPVEEGKAVNNDGVVTEAANKTETPESKSDVQAEIQKGAKVDAAGEMTTADGKVVQADKMPQKFDTSKLDSVEEKMKASIESDKETQAAADEAGVLNEETQTPEEQKSLMEILKHEYAHKQAAGELAGNISIQKTGLGFTGQMEIKMPDGSASVLNAQGAQTEAVADTPADTPEQNENPAQNAQETAEIQGEDQGQGQDQKGSVEDAQKVIDAANAPSDPSGQDSAVAKEAQDYISQVEESEDATESEPAQTDASGNTDNVSDAGDQGKGGNSGPDYANMSPEQVSGASKEASGLTSETEGVTGQAKGLGAKGKKDGKTLKNIDKKTKEDTKRTETELRETEAEIVQITSATEALEGSLGGIMSQIEQQAAIVANPPAASEGLGISLAGAADTSKLDVLKGTATQMGTTITSNTTHLTSLASRGQRLNERFQKELAKNQSKAEATVSEAEKNAEVIAKWMEGLTIAGYVMTGVKLAGTVTKGVGTGLVTAGGVQIGIGTPMLATPYTAAAGAALVAAGTAQVTTGTTVFNIGNVAYGIGLYGGLAVDVGKTVVSLTQGDWLNAGLNAVGALMSCVGGFPTADGANAAVQGAMEAGKAAGASAAPAAIQAARAANDVIGDAAMSAAAAGGATVGAAKDAGMAAVNAAGEEVGKQVGKQALKESGKTIAKEAMKGSFGEGIQGIANAGSQVMALAQPIAGAVVDAQAKKEAEKKKKEKDERIKANLAAYHAGSGAARAREIISKGDKFRSNSTSGGKRINRRISAMAGGSMGGGTGNRRR